MSAVVIGQNPVLENLDLFIDASSFKCFSGSATTNELSQDYVGVSGSEVGNVKSSLSGIFGVGIVSKKPQGSHVWNKGSVDAGKLTRRSTLYFNGVDNYYSIADNDKFSFSDGNVSLPFSIVAYVKFTSIGDEVVISKYGTTTGSREWVLYRNSSGKLRFLLEDGSGNIARGDSTSNIPNNEWIQVAATFSAESANSSAGDDIQLYVNGAAIATTTTTGPGFGGLSNTSQDVWIGRYTNSYANMWLKKVQVYNRTLSAEEINTMFERGKFGSLTNKEGTANGEVYTSDFSADEDGAIATRSTVTGNIDIGGEVNTLRMVVDTSTNSHFFTFTDKLIRGEKYLIQFKYYIPSSNSHLDGIIVVGQTTGGIFNDASPTKDTWIEVMVEYNATGSTINEGINFYGTDGGATSFTDAGGNDAMYITDLRITRQGRILDIDFGDDDDTGSFNDRASRVAVTENNGVARSETQYYMQFARDNDGHSIMELSRNPASGATFDWSDYLSLYGAHEDYVSSVTTSDYVSFGIEVESNIKNLFTGVRFFDSGAVEDYVPINRVLLPNEYELYYATSFDLATGGNPVGFDLLFNQDLSSGWSFINLKKPMLEISDHASMFTPTVRGSDNVVFTMIPNGGEGAGDLTNNVRASGTSLIEDTYLNYPPNTFWEFNGVDTNIVFPYSSTDNLDYSIEVVFSLNVVEAASICGFSSSPRFEIAGTDTLRADLRTTNATNFTLNTSTVLDANRCYHAVLSAKTLSNYNNFTGSVYLNGELDGGVGGAGGLRLNGNFVFGDDLASSRQPLDGRIYMIRLYNGKSLTHKETLRNFLNLKQRYGIS